MINIKELIDEIYEYEHKPIKELYNEGITFQIVKFGTDFLNSKWEKKYDEINFKDFYYTFFRTQDINYIVQLYEDGWIKFNTISDNDVEKLQNSTINIDDIFKFVKFGRVSSDNPFWLFGAILYVVMEGIKVIPNIYQVYFKGADPKLQKLYKKMTGNGQLLHALKNRGFKYEGTDEDENIIFKRVF